MARRRGVTVVATPIDAPSGELYWPDPKSDGYENRYAQLGQELFAWARKLRGGDEITVRIKKLSKAEAGRMAEL